MVAEISGAGLSHSVVGQLGAAEVQRPSGVMRPEGVLSPQSVDARAKQEVSSAQVAGSFAQLRVRQDGLNKAASVVKEVGKVVEQSSQLLDKIESKLGEIVKMYPPYPIDSPQRIELLNNIGGLRKQIDSLTFPPPDAVKEAGRLLGAKTDETDKNGDAVFTTGALAAINDRMWDIPALDPLTASDADVTKLLEQVKAKITSLEELQSGMWQDVISFVKEADSLEAQNEAAGVREQIADLGSRGIGGNSRQLLQAAESN